MSERGKMVVDFEGDKILLEEEKGERNKRMKKIFVTMKETLQYVGIIGIALLSGLFLGIKMVFFLARTRARKFKKNHTCLQKIL